MNEDIRIVKINLSDSLIKDVDSNGDEKLRFGIEVEGKQVLIKFPKLSQWDEYNEKMAILLMTLSQVAGNMEMPDSIEDLDESTFSGWAARAAIALKFKKAKELVEDIFFTYMGPEVQGLAKNQNPKNWLRKNMDISHIFIMFQSILQVDQWFKKKSLQTLGKIFPDLIQLSSKDISLKNTESAGKKSGIGQSFDFTSL